MRCERDAPQVTKRDTQLFHSLSKYGVLTTAQLTRVAFPGIQASTVLRRLRRLESAGYLYRVSHALPGGELVWCLAKKGEALIGVKTSMPRPNRNGLAHDVRLSDLRMRLEVLGLCENYLPDWSIRSQTFDPRSRRENTQIIPDGLFTAVLWNDQLYPVALELEIHAKTTQRYVKIFTKYQCKRTLSIVWYFVKTESFAKALIAKWNRVLATNYQKAREPCHLIVTVLPEFEADPRSARVFFTNGSVHKIEKYFQITEPKETSAARPQNQNTPAQAVGREKTESVASGSAAIAS